MTLIICIALWVAFATGVGIAARNLAVKWAEHKGWSALTMPMKYHAYFIFSYLVIVQAVWLALYLTFVH